MGDNRNAHSPSQLAGKERITYVRSELKIGRAQGDEEVARDQGQENIAAKS